MLLNIFRTAFRSLRRNRGFALLNVGGLALGMACVILIALYVQDERGVDRFHERADRIARIDVDFVENGEVNPAGNSQGILAPALVASMPEVEATVRFTYADPVLRARGEPSRPSASCSPTPRCSTCSPSRFSRAVRPRRSSVLETSCSPRATRQRFSGRRPSWARRWNGRASR